jgi:hypothetical protein
MPFCTRGELERLWTAGGLTDVVSGELWVTARYEDFAALWEPLERGVAPSGAYAAALDEPRRAALRRELRELLGRPEGPFALSARAWSVVGRA